MMPTSAKLLLPLLAGTALVSCAPALPARTFEDPVFATGQVWELGTPSGTKLTLTVPERDKTAKYPAYADTSPVDGRANVLAFWYDPVDSDPEFINVSQTSPESRTGDICYVREPGKVQVGQTLDGAYFGSLADAFAHSQAYVDTGAKDTLKSCTLKRIK